MEHRLAAGDAAAHRPPDLEAEARLRALLDDAGAIVRVGDLPAVTGDDHQLVRLFQNLLENAVEYRRPHEAPLIDVTAARQGRELVVAVRDNGIEFDQQYAERSSNRFIACMDRTCPEAASGWRFAPKSRSAAAGVCAPNPLYMAARFFTSACR